MEEQMWDKVREDARKARVRVLVMQIVTGKVIRGELDPLDETALRAAFVQAGQGAEAIENAAKELLP